MSSSETTGRFEDLKRQATESLDEVLEPQATASYVKVPLRTLDKWRYQGTGPAYLKVGRHVRYRRADLDAWLDAQRVTPAGGGLSA